MLEEEEEEENASSIILPSHLYLFPSVSLPLPSLTTPRARTFLTSPMCQSWCTDYNFKTQSSLFVSFNLNNIQLRSINADLCETDIPSLHLSLFYIVDTMEIGSSNEKCNILSWSLRKRMRKVLFRELHCFSSRLMGMSACSAWWGGDTRIPDVNTMNISQDLPLSMVPSNVTRSYQSHLVFLHGENELTHVHDYPGLSWQIFSCNIYIKHYIWVLIKSIMIYVLLHIIYYLKYLILSM